MPGTVIGLSLNLGYPGDFARNGQLEIDGTRPVNSTTAINPLLTPIYFGDACFLIPDATGGSRVSAQGLVVSTAITGTATSGSNSLTVSSATGVAVGQVVVGAGIPIGTTITALSGTTATLSVNTTAALSAGTALTIASQYLTYAFFAGFAVREVKSMETYFQPGTMSSPNNAFYAPGTAVGVLKRGNVKVVCTVGSPLPGGNVFLRVGLNSGTPAGIIGGIESAADGSNTIQLANCKFWGVPKDTNNVCEIEVLSINQV